MKLATSPTVAHGVVYMHYGHMQLCSRQLPCCAQPPDHDNQLVLFSLHCGFGTLPRVCHNPHSAVHLSHDLGKLCW